MVKVEKVLNNNVVVGYDDLEEIVLIGRGIGFGKKKGETLDITSAEKVYKLEGHKDTSRYQSLVQMADAELTQSIIEAIDLIEDLTHENVDDRILLTLTDHILFAIVRMNEGIEITNPFLHETKALYPKEYHIAEQIVEMFRKDHSIHLPDEEIGFVALHIHSAIYNRTLQDMNMLSEIVHQSLTLIEQGLNLKVDKGSILHDRFVRHISFCVQRVMNGEYVPNNDSLENLLKIQYPECYNISIKIVKMIQHKLNKKVYDSEVMYLTMHIQQFKNESIH